MGVPALFKYLQKKYSNIVTYQSHVFFKDINLYLDYNGFIHNCTHGDPSKTFPETDELRFEAIITETNRVIDILKPETTYIAIDGVAPLAKLYQQRNRRYIAAMNKNKSMNCSSAFDSNQISPGTEFMVKLKKAITEKSINGNSIITYWDSVGEGEHKIMKYIRNTKDSNICVIHGLDADLIILSLITKMQTNKDIYLMREETSDSTFYVSITKLHDLILTELKQYQNFKEENNDNLIYTWIIVQLFMGNDFLPPIPSLFIKEDAISNMMKIIDWNYKKIGGLLYSDNKINMFHIENLLTILGRQEFKQFCYRYNKTPEYLDNEGGHISINLNEDGYKGRYYFSKLLLNNEDYYDKKIIMNMCKYYLLTIQWIINYYKGKEVSFQWNYPYYYAPFASDFSSVSHLIHDYIFNIKHAVSIDEQLKFILPPKNNKLSYKIDPNLQKEEWKGILLIPE